MVQCVLYGRCMRGARVVLNTPGLDWYPQRLYFFVAPVTTSCWFRQTIFFYFLSLHFFVYTVICVQKIKTKRKFHVVWRIDEALCANLAPVDRWRWRWWIEISSSRDIPHFFVSWFSLHWFPQPRSSVKFRFRESEEEKRKKQNRIITVRIFNPSPLGQIPLPRPPCKILWKNWNNWLKFYSVISQIQVWNRF